MVVVTFTTAPLPGAVAADPTVTYIAPSGPWAIPPGTGSEPPPMCCTAAGFANGMRTRSPGGPAVGWNISVPQKLPARSKVHAVTVVRPLAHTWAAVR